MGYFFGVPRLPRGMTSRPRLTEKLDSDVALTIVRGGQGIGKTVAVADWATGHAELSESIPGIWFTVDSESGSRFALWAAVLQQILDSGLISRDENVSALIAAVESTSTLRRRLAQVLSRLASGVILVLDNCHLIEDVDATELSLDIASVVQATPRLRVVLIARGELELERGEHGVVLETATVSAAELAFTVTETREVMVMAGLANDLTAQASALHTATAGHPLLVRGALIANEKGFVTPTLLGTPSMEDAAMAAVREIALARAWSSETLDFARAVSIAESLSVPLAIRLSGRDDAEMALNAMERLGLGIWERDAGTAIFVFVPALLLELRRVLTQNDPKRAAALHRIAAEHSFAQGKAIAALEHAIQAGDLGLAEDFLVRDWYELLRLNSAKVRALLGGMSKLQLSRHPLATMLLAIAHNASPAHKSEAIELFVLAAGSATVMGKSVPGPRRVLLLTISSVAQRLTGLHASSLKSAERAFATYERLSVEERDELRVIRTTMYSQLGISALHAGDVELALHCFEVSAAEEPYLRNFAWLSGLSLQAGLLADLGRLTEAAALVERAEEAVWPPDWRSGYAGSYMQIAEAYLALEDRDYNRAHRHLDSLAENMSTSEHWDTIIRVRGWILLGEGRSAEAAALLRAELRKHGRRLGGARRPIYETNLAIFEIARGDSRAAEIILRGLPQAEPLANVARALLEIARNRPSEALLAIDTIDRTAPLSVHAQGNAYVLRSAALLHMGDPVAAARSLREATALMSVHGAFLISLMIPRTDLDALCRMADDSGLTLELSVLRRGYDQREVFAPLQPAVNLSDREIVVLRELVRSSSIAEIADALFVSHNTVKSQLRTLYRKLRVNSRADALAEARSQGLLGEPDDKGQIDVG